MEEDPRIENRKQFMKRKNNKLLINISKLLLQLNTYS